MIETVTRESLEEIMPLVEGYLRFYNVSFDSLTAYVDFFTRFTSEDCEDKQFLFREGGRPVAFATVYFSYVTSVPGKIAVMNDLFTEAAHRGRGIGRKLIEHCRDYARKKGAVRLQWLTQPDNHKAARLYNSLDARPSEWIVYTYPV